MEVKTKTPKKIFVYALIDPRDDIPKYIGITYDIKKRYKGHLNDHKLPNKNNNKKTNWIKLLYRNNLVPTIEILDECTELDCDFWEQWWICLFKSWGFRLKNTSPGGKYLDDTLISKIKNTLKNHPKKKEITEKRTNSVKKFYQTEEGVKSKEKKNKSISEAMKSSSDNKASYTKERSNKRLSTIKEKYPNGLPTTGSMIRDKSGGLNPSARAVVQYDFKGNFIKEWDCFATASKTIMNSKKTKGSRDCLFKYNRTALGFIWRFKEPKLEKGELPNTIESIIQTVEHIK